MGNSGIILIFFKFLINLMVSYVITNVFRILTAFTILKLIFFTVVRISGIMNVEIQTAQFSKLMVVVGYRYSMLINMESKSILKTLYR